MQRFGLRAIFVLLLLLAVAGSFQIASLTAAATTGGWFGGDPSSTYLANVSGTDLLQNQPCTQMTVTVVSNVLNTIVSNEQPVCMVSTLAGLVSANGNLIEPTGFSKAYPIRNNAPGNSALIPIANQASGLQMRGDPSFPGGNLGIYKNFYSHLKFDVFTQSFQLSDAPDMTLAFANGRALPFNTSTLSFSENGQYMVADVAFQGFVRVNLATYDIQPFAKTLPMSSGNGLFSAATAIDSTGRYVTIGYGGDWGNKFFKIVDIDSCSGSLAASQYDLTNVVCSATDFYSFLATEVAGFQTVSGVSFINDHVVVADLYVGGGKYVRYELGAAGTQASREQYLAVGDSYISGEGAYNYRAGTDTDINRCHQSLVSYPFLFADTFSSSASVACSGAVIDNVVGNDTQTDDYQLKTGGVEPTNEAQSLAKLNHTPGVVLQDQFVGQDNPEVVTVSIGGNDVGFADIVKKCVVPFNDFSSASQNCYQTYEDRLELVNKINSEFDNLYKTYDTLKASNTSRRVYVIGYPQVISASNSCTANVRMSLPDRQFAIELVSYLDSVIEKAADKAGVKYVDTQDALAGHKLCDDTKNVAVNGLTEGNDSWLPIGNESYHPNALGHRLLADTIAAATHNFSATMPPPDSSTTTPKASDGLALLQAPKTGRVVYEVESAGDDAAQLINLVTPTSVGVSNLSGILSPNTNFDVVLHSTPTNLGTVKSTSAGTIQTNITVPAGMEPGYHTLHFYGKNIAGDPIDIQKMVYIEASAGDYDGDGVANAQDSCIGLPNSGVDVDKDGIDDACDAAVGEPPVAKTPSVDNQAPNDASGSVLSAVSDSGEETTLDSKVQTTVTAPNLGVIPTKIITVSSWADTTVLLPPQTIAAAGDTGLPNADSALLGTAPHSNARRSERLVKHTSYWFAAVFALAGLILLIVLKTVRRLDG